MCVGEKCRFFAHCSPKFGLRELTGYELYQSFASVVVRRDRSAINTLAPSEGSLFSATSESAGELDCDAHNVVVGIRTLPLNARDVHPLGTEDNVLTRASLLSLANRKSEVPLLLITRVSLP